MSSEVSVNRVGFVGAGRMATAFARGLLSAGFATVKDVIASDVIPEALERFVSETGGRAAAGNAELFSESEIVVLAVKPQQMSDLLCKARRHATPEPRPSVRFFKLTPAEDAKPFGQTDEWHCRAAIPCGPRRHSALR